MKISSFAQLVFKHLPWAGFALSVIAAFLVGGLLNAQLLPAGAIEVLVACGTIMATGAAGAVLCDRAALPAGLFAAVVLFGGNQWSARLGDERTSAELARVTAEMQRRAAVVEQALILHELISAPQEGVQADIRIVDNALIFSAEIRREAQIGALIVPDVTRRRGEIARRDLDIALSVLESRGMPPSGALHASLSTAIAAAR